jgi:N-acyl-L-homoserine lactone synthetase
MPQLQPHWALSHRSLSATSKRSTSLFADQVSQLLCRIDCKLADTSDQREAIFRLRYRAYMREEAISENSRGTFSDSYDEKENGFLFGFYIDGELASSIRVHVASKAHTDFTSFEVFSDYLQPELEAGQIIVDTTRFVTDEAFSRLYRALPYATMRVAGMACEYFGADQLLAAVRLEHQAFYRRVFNHHVVCQARPYPGLTKPLSLMTVHYPKFVDQVHARYPFFRSTMAEQQMLFGAANGWPLLQQSSTNASPNNERPD